MFALQLGGLKGTFEKSDFYSFLSLHYPKGSTATQLIRLRNVYEQLATRPDVFWLAAFSNLANTDSMFERNIVSVGSGSDWVPYQVKRLDVFLTLPQDPKTFLAVDRVDFEEERAYVNFYKTPSHYLNLNREMKVAFLLND